MSYETDDTTIGRGGWALVIASGVISFLILHLALRYHLFPALMFALAIALVVLLILYRLAVAVNRHDDAEAARQVRKIVPASTVSEGTTRVSGIEGAQSSAVMAVPVRPDVSAASPIRPAAVVTPLSRVEPAPIIPPQPVAPPPVVEPPETFVSAPDPEPLEFPDVWAKPAPSRAPKPAPDAEPKPVAEPKPAAEVPTKTAGKTAAKAKSKATDKPKAGFKTKADLEAEAAAKTSVAKTKTAAPKAKADAKPKPDLKPKAETKAAPAAKAEPGPKAATKPKAAAKPKAAKAVPAGLVRLSAPRGGVADDLKEIEGIGPAIEKLVNGLGFYHFDQIAAWSDEDVAKVDAELRTFKGRIQRDKWVAQAKIIVTEGLIAFRERAKTNDY